jgi:uncharacterized cupredoxin-like copper-binding protein
VHARTSVALAAAAALVVSVAGCDAGPGSTPPITPGTDAAPRAVNIIARDFSFEPAAVDLAPGETVLFHIVNAGLVVHEAVVGDMAVQDAWEVAEAAAANPPPGPTPAVSVPPDVAGLRVVVQSGQRADVRWTVPDAAPSGDPWFVGCHIPGHWALGMVVPVRFVGPDGRPLASP